MIGGNPCCIGVGFEAQYHLGGFGSHSFQCAFCSLVHGVFNFFWGGLVGAYFLWKLVGFWHKTSIFLTFGGFSMQLFGFVTGGYLDVHLKKGSSIFHWCRGTPSWGCGLMSLQISWCFYHVGCSAWFLWFTGCSSDLMGFHPPSLHSDASFQLPTMVDGHRPPPEDYRWS